MADSAWLNGDRNKLENLRYNKRDADFSGLVMYFTPKGQLTDVWRYVNGKIILQTSNSGNQKQSLTSNEIHVNTQEKECWDYYLVPMTNGRPDGPEQYLFTICYEISGGGGGGADGDGAPPATPNNPKPNCSVPTGNQSIKVQNLPPDGGGDDGTGYPQPTDKCPTYKSPVPSIYFDTDNLFLNLNGLKPFAESPDKCSGLQQLQDKSLNEQKETVGLLTSDGKFLCVAVTGYDGGNWGGLYNFEGQAYYTYPSSAGAPTQTYSGMINRGGQYYIPVVATVHTHYPCHDDGTDGVTGGTLSSGDKNLANKYPMMNHYIVGCDALGKFANGDNSATLLSTGTLSSTCSKVN
ncbi:hypothetical protein [Mucilaginibacter ginkgonis]|uniref:Uncharacterized protein n=1 Tax=Mucilaginibacter ginkgonis TaxID=2682091 RepID=A0A6I4I1S7_9SPHI|nr:hypothetical protein [Mucilaginibacter ginkgonis]QQL48781.1 hypothetical protein GO620_011395 [Mucilaginibacter ginkgonis]